MATILNIETSTEVCSVALTADGQVLGHHENYDGHTHSTLLSAFVRDELHYVRSRELHLDAVAVSVGPGSYTGLRIGIAAVKGIVMGAPHLKCAAVSTLEALAYGASAFQGRIVPVMYARPKIVYAGCYESRHGSITRLEEDRVTDEAAYFSALDTSSPVMLTGDRSAEIKSLYFADDANVITAPAADRLQRASALCGAFLAAPERAVPPEALEASYLQATKAEKDKAHRD